MKRILLATVLLSVLFTDWLYAAKQAPEEGYARTYFVSQTLGANATSSILLEEPVSRISIWLDQSASFTFQVGAGFGFLTASATDWKVFIGSTSLELLPIHLSADRYMWIKNGAATQTIRVYTFGQ